MKGENMKHMLLVVFAALLAQGVQAQSFFSLQYQVAEPTESFRESAGTGVGLSTTYMHFISPRFALSGSFGYLKWGPRTDFPSGNQYKFESVPVQLGGSFLLSKGIVAPYLGLSLGMDYIRLRTAVPNSAPVTYADQSELKFGFAPHVGVGVHVAGTVGILLTGSYHVMYTTPTSKFFAFKAGLALGF
jgi:hypothetical protein